MVFSADNHLLIKLLRQKKGYSAKKFIVEFSSKPWTLSGLNKRLPQNVKYWVLHVLRQPHESHCNYCLHR